MTRILGEDDVRRAITMEECIECIEDALRETAAGWTWSDAWVDRHMPTSWEGIARAHGVSVGELPERIAEAVGSRSYVEPEAFEVDPVFVFRTMFGALPSRGFVALRASPAVVAQPAVGGRRRKSKVPAGPQFKYTALQLIFSSVTGALACVMPDGLVQCKRVAATGAVGVKYLSRSSASRLAVLGSGMMADGFIEAISKVRSLERIRVFSPTRAHREALADRWRGILGADVEAADSPEDAVRDAEVVVAATNAEQPAVEGRWLPTGCHLQTTTPREVAPDCYSRADLYVHAWRDMDIEPVEYALPAHPERNAFVFREHYRRLRELRGERPFAYLEDIIAGSCAGRTSDEQVTFAYTSPAGVQFAALGARIVKNAEARSLGHQVPTDWFQGEMHP